MIFFIDDASRIVFADYAPNENCCNEEVMCMCHKCGKCGRKFNDNGFLIEEAENNGYKGDKRES